MVACGWCGQQSQGHRGCPLSVLTETFGLKGLVPGGSAFYSSDPTSQTRVGWIMVVSGRFHFQSVCEKELVR